MRLRLAPLLLLLLIATPAASAQAVREHIEAGDRAASALDPSAALDHYRAAMRTDSMNVHALTRGSAAAVELGEFEPNSGRQSRLYGEAERLARRAVAASPRSAEAHFALARALGRRALAASPRERVRYATDVRAHAMAALAIDSAHAGALHVMGAWNAEVMRLNGVTRMVARNFLGGQVFGSASWANAVRLMERCVALEPDVIVHRLGLAKIYLDLAGGKRAAEYRERAREQLEQALALRPAAYNDRHYVVEARQLLRRL